MDLNGIETPYIETKGKKTLRLRPLVSTFDTFRRIPTHSDGFRRTSHLNGLEEDVDETHETQQTGDQEGGWEKEGVLRVEGFQKGPPKG